MQQSVLQVGGKGVQDVAQQDRSGAGTEQKDTSNKPNGPSVRTQSMQKEQEDAEAWPRLQAKTAKARSSSSSGQAVCRSEEAGVVQLSSCVERGNDSVLSG